MKYRFPLLLKTLKKPAELVLLQFRFRATSNSIGMALAPRKICYTIDRWTRLVSRSESRIYGVT